MSGRLERLRGGWTKKKTTEKMQNLLENTANRWDNRNAAAGDKTAAAPLTDSPVIRGDTAMADLDPTLRKALSVRTRFEVFKRDKFTCRYCCRATPEVVLQIDHVVPVADGGSDDPMNLVTACWDCNAGKSAVPLSEIITGEDPHDRAILLLEKQRQLREYDAVLADLLVEREFIAQRLLNWWCEETGEKSVPRHQFQWLVNQLLTVPQTSIKEAMSLALSRGMTRDWRYVIVVIRNWREDGKFGSS